MRLTVNIQSDNAAFDDEMDGRHEMARILRGLATCILAGRIAGLILDLNGNNVGSFIFEVSNDPEVHGPGGAV